MDADQGPRIAIINQQQLEAPKTSASASSSSATSPSIHKYKLTLRTGEERWAATEAQVFIQLFGDLQASNELPLPPTNFQRDSLKEFIIPSTFVGNLIKIRVRHNGKGWSSAWKLECVVVEDMDLQRSWTFVCGKWINNDCNNIMELSSVGGVSAGRNAARRRSSVLIRPPFLSSNNSHKPNALLPKNNDMSTNNLSNNSGFWTNDLPNHGCRKLVFQMTYYTRDSQTMYLSGSTPELGEWDLDRALRMDMYAAVDGAWRGEWRLELEIDSQENEIQYKYIVKDDITKRAIWEADEPRKLSQTGLDPVTRIRDNWGTPLKSTTLSLRKQNAYLSTDKKRVTNNFSNRSPIRMSPLDENFDTQMMMYSPPKTPSSTIACLSNLTVCDLPAQPLREEEVSTIICVDSPESFSSHIRVSPERQVSAAKPPTSSNIILKSSSNHLVSNPVIDSSYSSSSSSSPVSVDDNTFLNVSTASSGANEEHHESLLNTSLPIISDRFFLQTPQHPSTAVKNTSGRTGKNLRRSSSAERKLRKSIEFFQRQKLERLQNLDTSFDGSESRLERIRDRITKLKDNTISLSEIEALNASTLSFTNDINQLDASFQRNISSSWDADQSHAVEKIRDDVAQLHIETSELRDFLVNQKHLEANLQELHSVIGIMKAEKEHMYEKWKTEFEERRRIFNTLQELRGNIRVFCRVRPATTRSGSSSKLAVSFSEQKEECTRIFVSGKTFEYDRVFRPHEGQESVYSEASGTVISVMDGYNACIFAYGQTGSGKTYTMNGPGDDRGVNFLALTDLFRIRQERASEFDCEISISMLEIYNDQLKDLLVAESNSSNKLEIKQGADGIMVAGIHSERVECVEDVWDALERGQENRSQGKTSMNERSSRSHLVLCVEVKSLNKSTGARTTGRLNLIDLAGSERVSRSQAEGERLKEAQHINKSLAALGDVFSALLAKKPHIPYRNSKLTYLLQDCLGGDSKTLMFVNVSPTEDDQNETISSLNFALRVAKVQNGAATKHGDNADYMKTVRTLREKEEEIQRIEEKYERILKSQKEAMQKVESERNELQELYQRAVEEQRGLVKEKNEMKMRLSERVQQAEIKTKEELESIYAVKRKQDLMEFSQKLEKMESSAQEEKNALSQRLKESERKMEELLRLQKSQTEAKDSGASTIGKQQLQIEELIKECKSLKSLNESLRSQLKETTSQGNQVSEANLTASQTGSILSHSNSKVVENAATVKERTTRRTPFHDLTESQNIVVQETPSVVGADGKKAPVRKTKSVRFDSEVVVSSENTSTTLSPKIQRISKYQRTGAVGGGVGGVGVMVGASAAAAPSEKRVIYAFGSRMEVSVNNSAGSTGMKQSTIRRPAERVLSRSSKIPKPL